jgi:hypothetical protein
MPWQCPTLQKRPDEWVTDCKKFLDLAIYDAHLFNTWGWQQQLWGSEDNKSQLVVYDKIRTAVIDARIVDYPVRQQGWAFTKPRDYLTIALYESGRTRHKSWQTLKSWSTVSCSSSL